MTPQIYLVTPWGGLDPQVVNHRVSSCVTALFSLSRNIKQLLWILGFLLWDFVTSGIYQLLFKFSEQSNKEENSLTVTE